MSTRRDTAMPEHPESDELCNQVDVDRLRLIGDDEFTLKTAVGIS